MLFALVNAGRLYKLNPDTALERTCAKFRRRFTYLEEHTIREGRDLHDMTLAEMDAIWDDATVPLISHEVYNILKNCN